VVQKIISEVSAVKKIITLLKRYQSIYFGMDLHLKLHKHLPNDNPKTGQNIARNSFK
jgi:hypothetical protein